MSQSLSSTQVSTTPIWKLDPETSAKAQLRDGKTYDIVTVSTKEIQKAKDCFARCPKPGYKIRSVQGIYAPLLEKKFELSQETLQHSARFSSSSGELPIPLDRRVQVLNIFESMAKPHSDSKSCLRFLMTWYGIVETALEGICTIGIKPPSSDRVDAGYFGAASYSSGEAKYASSYGDQVTLLLNWTVSSLVFPVLDCDQLIGKTLKDGFDTHFTKVWKYLPTDQEQPVYKQHYPDTPGYFACRVDQKEYYTEIAVRDPASCLPRYLVKLDPIFNPHPHFVGRVGLLDQLAKGLTNHSILILHGPPKIGKSILVDAYINNHVEEFFFIWKIDCQTPGKLKESYLELAGYLRNVHEIANELLETLPIEKIISEVHGRLSKREPSSRPLLLIYDHLEKDFEFPTGVKIVVTTQNKNAFHKNPLIQFLQVGLLSEEEGRDLMKKVITKEVYSIEQMNYMFSICGLSPSILDLIATTIQTTNRLTINNYFQSDISNLLEHLIEMDHPLQDIITFFIALSGLKQDVEFARQTFLTVLEKHRKAPLVALLAMVPNRSGLRLLEQKKHQALLTNIRKMTANKPHGVPNIPEVKVTGYFDGQKKETFYLQEPHVRQLLVISAKDDPNPIQRLGEIKDTYKKSQHPVCQAKITEDGNEVGNVHAKQNPYSPLTEYAIHQLKDRIRGHSTPTSELFRFYVEGIVEGKKVKKEYRVLFSETIDGDPITENSKPNPKSWSWEVLCALLTRPGDGISRNYKMKNGNLFCVDNDISFVEPIDKTKIHFTSFLFHLFPPETALDQEVLKQFCKLDINFILNGWFDDVLKKEEKYLSLFTQPELDKLWREEEFSPSILLRKGTLSTLHTQFWYLQLEIRKKNYSVTAMELLNYLLSIAEDFNGKNVVGGHIYLAYKGALQATTPKKEEDELTYDWRVRIAVNRPLGSLSSKKALEASKLSKIPDLYVVDTTKQWPYQPSRALRELQVMATMHDEMIHESHAENGRSFIADFESCFNKLNKIWDEERLKTCLNSLKVRLDLDKGKIVYKLTIKNCPILSGKDLTEGLLNPQLEELSLENCNRLTDLDIYTILKKLCPKLKHFHLSQCPLLTTIGDGRFSYSDPLIVTHLETLSIFDSLLVTAKLMAPNLLKMDIRDSNLKELEVRAQSRLLIDIRNPNGVKPKITHSRLGDEDLLEFNNSKPTVLDLSEAEVTDKGFSTILGNGLEKLDLSLPKKLTVTSLTHLGKITSLKDLDLSSWHYLRDQDVNRLTSLNHLTSLNLSHCEQLTNECLNSLKTIKSLTYLDVSECPLIDEKGLGELKKALPKLEIVKI